ncbi:glycosyltransferase family 2 protein [Vibrio hepatarius]|uniref:Glycosyltransferase 2-like domain-containing protein n=1 Tax=Vibrio hepatarius TaxID=171383 RepID=A0A0M0HX77_9VIBR|nr:glycosyltransferase family 2 protein [Vibrio hepatarius]KOO06675.1 hypothetical protein AKJ31_15485 [Vibrio hepatarius]
MIILSIIIPANSRSETLVRAVSSIFKQCVNNVEVIITLRDGDIDTLHVLDEIKSKFGDKVKLLIINKPMNSTDDWNDGLSIASGKYLMLLEGDDYLPPNCLDEFRNAIDIYENLSLYVMATDSFTFKLDGYIYSSTFLKRLRTLKEVPPPSQTIFINANGFYKSSLYEYAPEIDFYYELISKTKLPIFVNNDVKVYREPSLDRYKGLKWKHFKDHYQFVSSHVHDYSFSQLIKVLFSLKFRCVTKIIVTLKNSLNTDKELIFNTFSFFKDFSIFLKWFKR